VSIYSKGLGVKRLTEVFAFIIWDICFEMEEETLAANNKHLYSMVVRDLINPENKDHDFINWDEEVVIRALGYLGDRFHYHGSPGDLLQVLKQRYAKRISMWLTLEEALTPDRVEYLVLDVVRHFLDRNRKFM
jgi:hypothetical protein